MAKQPLGIWGIDLGQCALKALRLEAGENGVVATAFDYVEHPKILSQPDADPDQLTREALEKFLSRNSLKGDQVSISVPGQSGLARFVKLPPVEEKKIVDIVRFEAKQQIPFNLEEVVWDYQKLSSGAVTDGFAMETEIGLFAMKRDMVSRYLQHFKDVNVDVHLVQMAPLALCNFVSYDLLDGQQKGGDEADLRGKKQCVVALDIGADSSNLVITDGARIIWQRPIPLGGNHFTRALTKDMKLTFAKAEHLKRNATKSPQIKEILSSLKPVLNDFVGEVQRSLGYFTNTHRDANIRYMVGLGNAFRLPGLQRFLGEKLQLDVRKLHGLNRLTGDPVVTAPAYIENVLSYAVAYGLALQGLKLSRLQTNLLPPEIQVDRLIKAKKPWAAAAAAALLVGATGLAGAYAVVGWAFGADSVKKAEEQTSKTVSADKALTSAFNSQQDKVKKEEDAVRSIIAGGDEMPNWMALNKFLSDVLPRPDVDNANLWGEKAQEQFLLNRTELDLAKRAYERYQKRLAGDKILPGPDDRYDEHLLRVDIDAVDARWAEDLAVYWTGIKSKVKEQYVRPKAHWTTSPKEKESGWVVELRGSTTHETGDAFLRNTLLENIAALGVRESKAADGKQSNDTSPPAADASKPEERKDPVIGNISHVVLYKVNETTDGSSFSLPSEIGSLLGGGGGQAGPGGSGGKEYAPMLGPNLGAGSGTMDISPKGGALSSGRSGWKPLGTDLGGAGSRGTGYPGSGSPPSLPSKDSSSGPGSLSVPAKPLTGPGITPKGPGGFPITPGGGPPLPEGGDSTKTPSNALKRYDFVLLFIWKEPIPSDKLRFPNGEPPPPTPATTTGPGFGGAGMTGASGGGSPPPSSGASGGGTKSGGDEFNIERGVK
jgi:type IV pilus assembly protein PilM